MSTKGKRFLAALVFAFAVFASCKDLGYTAEADVPEAAVPAITEQPEGGTYKIAPDNTIVGANNAPATITVKASAPDGGALTYRWFRADNEAQYLAGGGAAVGSGAVYTISAPGDGVYLFYVVVTNTLGEKTASVKSELVRVLINDPRNATFPDITADPRGMAYEWTTGTASITPEAISVTAAATRQEPLEGQTAGDTGVLSYQWYLASTPSDEGTAIPNATNAAYTPDPITEQNTLRYYYVVVTNYWENAPGRTETPIESFRAVVRTVTFNATITVNTADKRQYVRGFGVMAPFWGNSPQDSVADYEKMYNPNTGLGYNMLRIMIPVAPSGDSIRETMNRALNNELSGSRDRRHYYEIVKLVNGYNGYVLASPWSPPPSWKTNESVNGGGTLKKERWQDYANYLKAYAQMMKDKGAPIYAVSIQNEPNFKASYDGCEWTGPEMRDFFRQVGRFTNGVSGWGGGKSIPTVLTMFGESANSPDDSAFALNDTNNPSARDYVDLYARHLYGNAQVSLAAKAQAKGKEFWMTEYNVNGGNPETYPLDSTYNYIWKFINTIDCVIRLNEENAFIWWYGKRFYSQIGDGDYGTVDGAILPRGWALSHYAKYAIDTDQVGLDITGTTGAGAPIVQGIRPPPPEDTPSNFKQPAGVNFNNFSYNLDATAARATAFAKFAADGTTIESISLVLFTPTDTSGGGGMNLGNVKIQFPAGFTATKVTAMRSRSGATNVENMGKRDIETILLQGGNAAFITLPAGQILSVKFTK